jgi:hypothetical protein
MLEEHLMITEDDSRPEEFARMARRMRLQVFGYGVVAALYVALGIFQMLRGHHGYFFPYSILIFGVVWIGLSIFGWARYRYYLQRAAGDER